MIDATHTDALDLNYGYKYLVENGYFENPVTTTHATDSGEEIKYVFSDTGPIRIAYFELTRDISDTAITALIRELKRTSQLQYFWIVNTDTDRVRVVRTSRGDFTFTYNPTVHTGDVGADKRAQLDDAATDINALFDHSDVIDSFYATLWDYRAEIAANICTTTGTELTEQAALLAAQRFIDRTVISYFLVEKGIIVPVNTAGNIVDVDTETVFKTLEREHGDFSHVLNTIFFDGLSTNDGARIDVNSDWALHIPPLTNGLLPPSDFETVNGDSITEGSTITVTTFDWASFIDELNGYTWVLNGVDTTELRDELSTDVLTPGVLGHVYEKFVISVSKASSDASLDHVTDEDQPVVLTDGNSEVGAYYTGEDITDFKARRSLWEALVEKIDADLDNGTVPDALTVTDIYRAGAEKRGDIERAQRDGFSVLYEQYQSEPDVLEYIDSKLQGITVCDPAVGSGAFAIAVANTVFEWRSMCNPDTPAFELREDIVNNTVFGVDLLDGAVEICKLRLWLWAISALPVDTEPGVSVDAPDRIAYTPSIACNIKCGNSLIGFTDSTGVTGEQQTLGASQITRELQSYQQRVNVLDTDQRVSDIPDLAETYAELTRELNDWYAKSQRDADNNRVTIPNPVDTANEAWEALHTAPKPLTTLSVVCESEMPDSVTAYMEREGFTTDTYKARFPNPTVSQEAVTDLFEFLHGEFTAHDEWTVLIEREYTPNDFGEDQINAFHWPLEFPTVFSDDDGFDVVISNPPYGAALPDVEAPVMKNEVTYQCQGTSDSCEWFYERAFDLTHSTGVVSYIVSKSIAYYSSWSDIRSVILDETTLKHVFDVGLGFVGVNLETIALIHTCGTDAASDSCPTVHRTRDVRDAKSNQPVHLGWGDQQFMMDVGTIIFRPISTDERRVLDQLTSHDRCLGDMMSTPDTTRQLYIPDSTKETLGDGPDPYINKNPWVKEFYLEDIWFTDLSDYTDAIEKYAVPRVMLKVLRGTRLRAWMDPHGDVVGTEKLVNVPLEDSSIEEIAFVYAVLNHPCASYYLQKAVFSETTESARVMDGQYSKPIPIPDTTDDVETLIAHVSWSLTLARQIHHDSTRDLTPQIRTLQTTLEAIIAALYVDSHHDMVADWSDELQQNTSVITDTRALFTSFYELRFGTADGHADAYYTDIESQLEETTSIVTDWDCTRVLNSPEMRTITNIL